MLLRRCRGLSVRVWGWSGPACSSPARTASATRVSSSELAQNVELLFGFGNFSQLLCHSARNAASEDISANCNVDICDTPYIIFRLANAVIQPDPLIIAPDPRHQLPRAHGLVPRILTPGGNSTAATASNPPPKSTTSPHTFK